MLLHEESEEFAETVCAVGTALDPIIVAAAAPTDAALSPGCFFGFLVRGPAERRGCVVEQDADYTRRRVVDLVRKGRDRINLQIVDRVSPEPNDMDNNRFLFALEQQSSAAELRSLIADRAAGLREGGREGGGGGGGEGCLGLEKWLENRDWRDIKSNCHCFVCRKPWLTNLQTQSAAMDRAGGWRRQSFSATQW